MEDPQGEHIVRVTFCVRCGRVVEWDVSLCPHCRMSPRADLPLLGTVEDWRAYHLSRLEAMVEEGVDRVTWRSARDECTCRHCRKRDGRSFSIEEMREELAGSFCEPADRDAACRCAILRRGHARGEIARGAGASDGEA